jgi:hypothetical protein
MTKAALGMTKTALKMTKAALENTGNVVDRPRDLPDDIAATFRTTGFCE